MIVRCNQFAYLYIHNFSVDLLMVFNVYLCLGCVLYQHDPPPHCSWKTLTPVMTHDCEDIELVVELP